MIPMQSTKMVESHYVDAQGPRQGYIQLSPHRKSKRSLAGGNGNGNDSSKKIQTQQSQSVVQSRQHFKENTPFNVEIVDMPVRLQKAFQKIPSFKMEQVIVRQNTQSALEIPDNSEDKSRRKKITVTKLINQLPNPLPTTVGFRQQPELIYDKTRRTQISGRREEEGVASEQF